jgi:hypothetical protein
MSRRRKATPRDLAEEIVRRANASSQSGIVGYVVRLSDPPAPGELIQLAACRILRQPIAIMPAVCASVEEWVERYGRLSI